MPETTQADKAAESGASKEQETPKETPKGLSEEQVKQIESTLYSRFQSDLSTKEKELVEERKRREEVEAKLEGVEKLDDKLKQVEESEAKILEAEARTKLSDLVDKNFPELRGKERFIKLGTEDDMTEQLKDLRESFGLKSKVSESLKGQAGESGSFASLTSLPESELKKTLSKMSKEDLKKLYERTK